MNFGRLSFGLREALILAAIGIGIAVTAALHYAP
jgi:multisubunit Na+/H+ antiporter MnhC subunit